MALMCCLLAIIFTLAITCLAESVSLKAIRDHSNTLTTNLKGKLHGRRIEHFTPTHLESVGGTESDSSGDHQLLDIVLAASVDGKFHAINRTSGHALWSMSASSASPVPPVLAPLVRTNHAEIDVDVTDDETAHQELYVIEPQTGDIYVMATPTSPLQRLSFSMSQLVDMSPFSFAGEEERRVFVGRKETSLLLVELETGKVKATLNSECPWDPFDDLTKKSTSDSDLDELEGDKPPVSTSTEVFIGRTDYHISIHTRPLDPSSPKPPVQNLSFSMYGPNNQDIAMQSSYRRTADNSYIQSLANGEVLSFKAHGVDGTDADSSRESKLLWAHTFANPIVAIFDVLKTSDRQQPFVLLQPSVRLYDLMPHVDLPAAAKMDRLPNIDSAYVGLCESSGSLYAMTPDRFPLVAFGDTNFAHGGGHELIDPPLGKPFTPPDVVALPRAKTLTDTCLNGLNDLRCLTGARRLEEPSQARWNKLLDAAPVMPLPPTSNSSSAVDSEGYSGDPFSAANGVGNGSTPSWFWGADGRSSINEGGRNLFDARSALVSFLIAFVLSAVWIITRKLRWRTTSTAVPINIQVSEQVAPTRNPNLTIELPSVGPMSPPKGTFPTVERLDNVLTPNGAAGYSESPGLTQTDVAQDGEDSDRDVDTNATPGKRKGPRRRRGKKKKVIHVTEEVEEDQKPPNDGKGHDPELENIAADYVFLPTKADPSPSTPNPGSSLVVSDTVLGFGSHGTVVFQGSLQGRSVAVKRLLQDFVTLASREVSILQESDDHPNVIRYYYQEAHANFLYIALELCPASLADVIETPDQFRDISIAFEPKRALQQITSGLRHLHALKIVHRDIKPQNILISCAKPGGGKQSGHRMLISDFGLCKKLDVDQTSFLPTAHGSVAAGTIGWRAPEILRGEVKLDESVSDELSQSSRGSVGTPTGSMGAVPRLTKSVDIFALGCLFYYTLTNGNHPFGDRFEREVNILKNAKCLDGLERFGEEGLEAVDLIGRMLNPEASDRPSTTTCLLHPFFWDSGRRLTFLQDASDRFEIMCRDPREQNLITLETNAFDIVGHDWHSRLDKVFIENLGKFRKYDGKSVQDLLRALRNKKHHYQDLPDNVKRHLGALPTGFLSYFTRRFPGLFLHVHSVVAGTSLRSESMFRSYFELTD